MASSLKRLLPYVRRARRALLLGLACCAAATAVSMLSPWVLRYAIDGLMSGLSRSRLAWYAALMLAIAVADGGFRYLMRSLVIGASRQIEYDLRNDFFAHLERLPLSYYQAHRTGDLMSRATNDLGAVRMMVGPAVMYFATTALGFVLAVTLMLRIDARLTLITLLPLPAVSLATHYFGKAIHDRFERIQAQLSDMSAVVQEALSGVRVVRAYRQEAAEVARFKTSNDEYVARNLRLIRLQAAFYPSLTLCFGLSAVSLLWLGGRAVIDKHLTLGEFVALSRYLVMLSWPMIAFGWVINIAQRGMASWERMLAVMDTPPAIADAAALAAATAGETGGAIEVRHLTFGYPSGGGDVLHDLSFSVPAGTTVAIVGPTGSGKSTLVNLLPRLHEPPAASVFVDGVDVRDWSLSRLRAAIAVVPQEPFLFSETVGGNITFGMDDARDTAQGWARMEAAAATAALDADIQGFPKGYDTMVGERGITLSGGQKQRTALARALAVDPPILVLDDALSAVDTQTEETILQRLRDARRRGTRVIVAHRISTVRDADLILVLVDGRIVERGTHDELVERGGVYADMHRRQLLEDELAVS
jgi:ATP-binding cassette subfamily B protein